MLVSKKHLTTDDFMTLFCQHFFDASQIVYDLKATLGYRLGCINKALSKELKTNSLPRMLN